MTYVPPFLSAKNLQAYASDDLRDKWDAVKYRLPGGGVSYGYNAEILPEVCEIYLAASEDGNLLASQRPSAKAAEIIMCVCTERGNVSPVRIVRLGLCLLSMTLLRFAIQWHSTGSSGTKCL